MSGPTASSMSRGTGRGVSGERPGPVVQKATAASCPPVTTRRPSALKATRDAPPAQVALHLCDCVHGKLTTKPFACPSACSWDHSLCQDAGRYCCESCSFGAWLDTAHSHSHRLAAFFVDCSRAWTLSVILQTSGRTPLRQSCTVHCTASALRSDAISVSMPSLDTAASCCTPRCSARAPPLHPCLQREPVQLRKEVCVM